MSVWRPASLKQDDFVDIMKEVVPKLIEAMPMSDTPDSSMSEGTKRQLETSASSYDACPEPPAARARTAPASEVLSVECLIAKMLK